MGRYRFGSDFGGGLGGIWCWQKICKKEKECSVRLNIVRQSTSENGLTYRTINLKFSTEMLEAAVGDLFLYAKAYMLFFLYMNIIIL